MIHRPCTRRLGPMAILLLAVTLSLVTPTQALQIAQVFGSGMVIQAERPVPVWGKAGAGDAVTVSFGGQEQSTTADADGAWSVTLNPLDVSALGRDLRVDAGGKRLILTNVVVGDVWLCAGQSNMQKPWLGEVPAYDDELKKADHPLIREFRADPNIWSATPHKDYTAEGCGPGTYTWFPCTPETAKTWPTVPYFFATMLQRETGRPIGLLRTQVGATSAEAWIPGEALAEEPRFAEFLSNCRGWIDNAESNRAAFNAIAQAWSQRQQEAEAQGRLFDEKRPSDHLPELWPRWWAGVYHNANIAPLRNFAIRGVIWYQGENNAARKGGCAGDHDGYVRVMEILIGAWRTQFQQPELPFLQVQLSAFGGRRVPRSDEPGSWSVIRESQATVARRVPHTALAVSIDIGVQDNIHPPEKRPVGERLARLALRDVYGRDTIADGPAYVSHTPEEGRVRVRFDHAHGGLVVKGDALSGFTVAGSDGRYEWADARVEGNEVLVWSDKVPVPVDVRYGYAPYLKANLYNGEGLPAVPFRTDAYPLE